MDCDHSDTQLLSVRVQPEYFLSTAVYYVAFGVYNMSRYNACGMVYILTISSLQ